MSATRHTSIAMRNEELGFALLDGWHVSIELIGPWNRDCHEWCSLSVRQDRWSMLRFLNGLNQTSTRVETLALTLRDLKIG